MKKFSSLDRFKINSSPVKYNIVQEDEGSEVDSRWSDTALRTPKSKFATCQKLSLYLFLVSQSIIILILAIYVNISRTPSDLACAKQLSPYCETYI